MAWDPTDYKDMLDDDWNDHHQRLISMLDEQFFSGVYIDEMLRLASKILENPAILSDTEFEKMVNNQEADIEDLAKYFMENYYLTPMGRKRLRMKKESKEEILRAKTINENRSEKPEKPEKPDYYPDDNDWYAKNEPWKKNPETNAIMEKMLDEYETKWNSLEEVDYDQVLDVKQALWIGYNFGKRKESSWNPPPPIRDQEGNVTSDWRDNAVQ